MIPSFWKRRIHPATQRRSSCATGPRKFAEFRTAWRSHIFVCVLSGFLLPTDAMGQCTLIYESRLYIASTPLGTVHKLLDEYYAAAGQNASLHTSWCDGPAMDGRGTCWWQDTLTPKQQLAPYTCYLTPQKDLGNQCNLVSNPCNPATGNKYQTEVDYNAANGLPVLRRHYNSQLDNDAGFGYGWISAALKGLEFITTHSLQVRRGDGRSEPFTMDTTGAWHGDADTTLALTQDASGFTIVLQNGVVERYDSTGKIISETDENGNTTTYSYSSDGKLERITSPFGHQLAFAYHSSIYSPGYGRVSTITDPTGQAITYGYDANNNLARVDYPDGTTKLYHYNEPGLTGGTNLPHHLTGISFVDTQGVTTRYATYAYDATGKAIRTEHAQTDNGAPQERFTLAYNSDTQTTVTDPVGTNEIMTFATSLGVKNLVSKVNQLDGKSVQQVFDANNNLTCRKDEENRVTTYTYNATNQRTGMTEGLTGDCTNPATVPGVTRATTYEYLSSTLDLPRFIRRPSVATGQTFETEMVYGDAGHPNLPTQVIQRGFTPAGTSVSRTVTLGYNAFGQVNLINGPRTDVNDVTTLEYYECTTGGACGQLKKVTNALGHITTYDQYDANGRLRQMTDPNGLVTTYTYDPRGRVKTIVQTTDANTTCNPGNSCWQYSYTAWGDVSQVTDPDGVELSYQYDTAHNLRFIVDATDNYVHYTYDLKGNRTAENVHDASGVLMRTVGYAYDLRNHLKEIILAGHVTRLVNDAVGNLTQETDPNNHGTTHEYDALNRLFKTVNALSQETSYGQDANDRPEVITAPNGLSTQYEYDDLGNLLKEISRDRGTSAYTYDTAGNVLTATNALGQVTTYAYDALNRVTLQQSSDANTPRYNYYYDVCSKGRLCSINQDGQFHHYFSYDGLGRPIYQLNAAGAAWLYNVVTYSFGGRLTNITYPGGRTVDYQYDFQITGVPKRGNIAQISTTANGVTTLLARNFIHQPFGPAQSFSFGHNLSYWVSFDQAYRPVYQFSGPRYKRASYDPAGNLETLTDINNTAQTFDYSQLNELISASDTQAGSYGELQYSYLPNGNRESETRDGTSFPYYYYDSTNRLYHAGNSEWRLSDQAGNTIWSNATWTLNYDGYGRLLSAAKPQSSYGYNAFHQRTRKTAGGVTTSFLYGPRGELLYETTGATDKIYVYLDDMLLARIDGNQVYYYHTDHLGTPQMMTNSAGATVWKAGYEPFGWATVNEDPDGNGVLVKNNVRNAGMYADSETGLYYWYSRYYDPKAGRGISPDQMSVAEHVARWKANLGLPNQPPLEINPYVYVANNPLRWIDPDGHMGQGSGGSKAPGVNPPPFPNGNYEPGFAPQDSVCTVPMVGGMMNSNSCVLNCCKAHDDCYTRNGCNSSSWRGNYYGFSMACQQCNAEARRCVASAISNGCSSCSK